MSNDPTTTPFGEADAPKSDAKSSRGRAASSSAASYPGMMGDGTEEQNLGQTGNPSARIGQDEVEAAFSGSRAEKRSFLNKDDVEDVVEEAKDAAAGKLSALTDRVNAMRDQVQQSTENARAWAARQAEAAKQTASDRPVLVVSTSAGIALAIGLVAGFFVGRATADEYWD